MSELVVNANRLISCTFQSVKSHQLPVLTGGDEGLVSCRNVSRVVVVLCMAVWLSHHRPESIGSLRRRPASELSLGRSQDSCP